MCDSIYGIAVDNFFVFSLSRSIFVAFFPRLYVECRCRCSVFTYIRLFYSFVKRSRLFFLYICFALFWILSCRLETFESCFVCFLIYLLTASTMTKSTLTSARTRTRTHKHFHNGYKKKHFDIKCIEIKQLDGCVCVCALSMCLYLNSL